MKNSMLDNNHFVVSYELLVLLQWLIHHEQESLKRIIARAYDQGLQHHITTTQRDQKQHAKNSDELKEHIIDFFALVETLMVEIGNERETGEVISRNLFPELDHIDNRMYDADSIAASIAKAHSAKKKLNAEGAKEVLYKELLKRWKPHKKHIAIN